jgi:hypothetical protein
VPGVFARAQLRDEVTQDDGESGLAGASFAVSERIARLVQFHRKIPGEAVFDGRNASAFSSYRSSDTTRVGGDTRRSRARTAGTPS